MLCPGMMDDEAGEIPLQEHFDGPKRRSGGGFAGRIRRKSR
jgi:hypothetical protein